MKTLYKCIMLFLVMCLTGCATVATFKLPQGTEVKFLDRDQAFKAGEVAAAPFPWKSSNGIDYNLTRKGKVVKTGKLSAKFRIVSLFWIPVYSLIVQPIGFKYECYDLTKSDVKECTLPEKKKK